MSEWISVKDRLPKKDVKVYQFIARNIDLYNASKIRGLISMAILDGDAVILNADW